MTKKQSKAEDSAGEVEEVGAPVLAPEDFIGERILSLRAAKGLNHDGLSRLTKLLDKKEGKGINRTTIRGYEVGMYKPGARELRMLSEALEVSPSWLLLGTGDVAAQLSPGVRAAGEKRYREFEKLIRVALLLPWVEKKSRDSVYELIIAMARLSLGEERFRAEDAMLRELSSIVIDTFEDYKKEKAMPDLEKLKPVFEKYMSMMSDKFNHFVESE